MNRPDHFFRIRNRHLHRVSFVCLVVLATCQAAHSSDVFFASRIWTGRGPVIDEGVLVVRDGKIKQVGQRASVSIPKDAAIHDLGNAVLIPGLVIAHTNQASGSDDGRLAIAPQQRAIDGFDFFEQFDDLLRGGITTVQVAPGSSRLLPGQGAVVKLAGDSIEQRTLSAEQCLHIVLSRGSRNPPSFFEPPVGAVSVEKPLEPASPQLAGSLASAVSGLRALLRASERQASLVADIETDESLLAIAEYQTKQRTVQITAETAAEIRAAVELVREFDLRCVLVDAQQLSPWYDQFDQWRPHVRGVVLRADTVPGQIRNPPIPSDREPQQQPIWRSARKLVDHRIKVGVRPASDDNLSDVLFSAGLLRQSGLPASEVLKMVTLWPAQILDVADRVGSLSPGKDADFVALTSDPFETGSHIRATYIGGTAVYERRLEKSTIVLRAGEIYDGTSKRIRNGSIVVEDGVIRQVATTVSAPIDATIHSYPRGVIVPGFVDLGTGLGLGGPLTGSISVQTKLGEQLYSGDPAVDVARQGGVTTALLAPTGNSPGPVVAFKLADKLRVLKDPVALRFTLSGNLTTAVAALERTLAQAKAYDASWKKYESELVEYKKKLAQYEKDKASYDAQQRAEEAKKEPKDDDKQDADGDKKDGEQENGEQEQGGDEEGESDGEEDDAQQDAEESSEDETEGEESKEKSDQDSESQEEDDKQLKAPTKPKEPSKPRKSTSLEAYRPLMSREIPALVTASNGNEIEAAIKLFHEKYKLRTIIVGADGIVRRHDLLKREVGFVVGPTLVRTIDQRRVGLAQVLASRGIPFGFQSRATTGAKQLPLAVQYAVHNGLSANDGIKGLTSAATQLISLDEEIGSLAAGKDADLVVLSGPPFALSSRVLAVMIDGKWVYEEETEE